MDKSDTRAPSPVDAQSRSVDYLRKRSQHRLWWNSARVAMQRAQALKALYPPVGGSADGKKRL